MTDTRTDATGVPADPAPDAVGTDAAGADGIHRFHDEERRPHHDPRDATDIDLDAVNNQFHYALFAVFRLTSPLPPLEDTRRRLVGESLFFIGASEVTTRGWYDVAGFRSDADLLVWWLSDDPEKLQDANHHHPPPLSFHRPLSSGPALMRANSNLSASRSIPSSFFVTSGFQLPSLDLFVTLLFLPAGLFYGCLRD